MKTDIKYDIDLDEVIRSYSEGGKKPVTSNDFAQIAKNIKLKSNDNKQAEEILNIAFSKIKCFDDGLFYVNTVVKYQFPEFLSSYAPLMLSYAETVEELLYSNDLYLANDDTSKCRRILKKTEKKAANIDDYLQICGSLDLLDQNWAKRIFQKAENIAETCADYLKLIQKQSYFYGWPEFLGQSLVKKVAEKAVRTAESAEDFRNLSKCLSQYADILDPNRREKKLQKIINQIGESNDTFNAPPSKGT